MANCRKYIRKLATSTLVFFNALSIAGSARAVEYNTYLLNATAPTGGVWVPDGTGLAGGHLWVSDHLQGFCRLEPVDAENTQAVLNPSGCVLADGQPAYDAARQIAYIPDGSSKSVGVVRVKLNQTTKFFTGGRTNLSGTLQVANKRCKNNTLAGCRPTATALDPAGNLYIATKRTGDIYRIKKPFAAKPGALHLVAQTEDGAGAQGLAFVGNDLYIAEGTSVTVIPDPTNLDTSDGVGACGPKNVCAAINTGFEGSFAGVPILPLTVGSDGSHLYVGDFFELNVFDPTNGSITPMVTIAAPAPAFFRNISGIAYAPSSGPGPARLFWADDPSAGATVLLGHWYAAPMSDLGLP